MVICQQARGHDFLPLVRGVRLFAIDPAVDAIGPSSGNRLPVASKRAGEAAVRHLFLFIGADPNTDWLAECGVALDKKGFVRTGGDIGDGRHALETSRHCVFAIGDVRSGSIKRVAAAVGEGAQVAAALHAYLAQAAGDAVAPAIVGRL